MKFYIEIYVLFLSGEFLLHTQSSPIKNGNSDCIDYLTNIYDSAIYPVREMESRCMENFLEKSTKQSDKNTMNYLKSLFRKRINEHMQGKKLLRRTKRIKRQTTSQTIVVTSDKMRHEVRSPQYDMTWGRFANRTRRLANYSSVRRDMSDYEVLASLHSGDALKSVYGGPAYLAWQRIYLLLFEAAIGVPVPYWDCSLDFHMRDPTRAVVWSPKYFGNGYGEVTTGPFKDFRAPSGAHLFRNIGSDGTLFSKQSIELIMSKTNHSEISEPLEDPRYSLEGHSLGAHVWVDGTFSRKNIAAYDPIYFVYHSFIDMLWQAFREQMVTLYNKDPAMDYADKGPTEHSPQNLMTFQPRYSFIPLFRNIQGYSHAVSNMIHFAPGPECPDCFNTTELYCSIQDICISREVQVNFPVPIPKSRREQAKHLSKFARGALQGANPSELPKDEQDAPDRTLAALAAGFRIDPGPKFKSPFRDVRTRGDAIPTSPNSAPRG